MDEKGYEFIKYDDDHFVVHMDHKNMCLFMAVQGILAPESDGMSSGDAFVEALQVFFPGHDSWSDDKFALECSEHLARQLKGQSFSAKFPHSSSFDDVSNWPVWRSIMDVVPSDRVEEVQRALKDAIENQADSNKDRPLSEAFTWSDTPQGHVYWNAWCELSVGKTSRLPSVDISYDNVDEWEAWKSIAKVVPEDRKHEVQYELLRAARSTNRVEEARTKALGQAFTWDSSPQGHDYWGTWQGLAIGIDKTPPPPPAK